MLNKLAALFFFNLIIISDPVFPTSPASEEDLLYTTLNITSNFRDGEGNVFTRSGTGYIYNFIERVKDTSPYLIRPQLLERQAPYLVTNKHVIDNVVTGTIGFNLTNNTTYYIDIGNQETPFQSWFIRHPKEENDLCAMKLDRIMTHVQLETRSLILYRVLDKTNLIDFKIEQAIQDILMVGYPMGITDMNITHILPIVRKGITSSHIRSDFQNKPQVLVDIACFPGSSGSPVFLRQSVGNFFQAKLLGTAYAIPQYEAQGGVVCENNGIKCTPIPTLSTNIKIPSNLGFVIKSTELEALQIIISSTIYDT